MRNQRNRFGLLFPIICIFLLIGCVSGINQKPWYESIKTWTPEQKANFFMSTWKAEHEDYKAANAIPNKPESLIKVLKIKREILEQSRKPIRAYASLVRAGGKTDPKSEDEIISWLRQLQTQILYGGN